MRKYNKLNILIAVLLIVAIPSAYAIIDLIFPNPACTNWVYPAVTFAGGVNSAVENDGGFNPCKGGGVMYRIGGQKNWVWDNCLPNNELSEYYYKPSIFGGGTVMQKDVACKNSCVDSYPADYCT